MSISRLILASASAVMLYALLLVVFGFEGFVAHAINFMRVAMAPAVLFVYIPTLRYIFQRVPPPGRDYLLAGIILIFLSALGFSISNEAGRFFGYTTSVYLNPLAGAFSLLLVVGGFFLLIAPGVANRRNSAIAVLIGISVGIAVVFVAPLFR